MLRDLMSLFMMLFRYLDIVYDATETRTFVRTTDSAIAHVVFRVIVTLRKNVHLFLKNRRID